MESINENIFKMCNKCNIEKSIELFRAKHLSCRNCNSVQNYNRLKEKDYYKNVYIEQREQRLEYQKNQYLKNKKV